MKKLILFLITFSWLSSSFAIDATRKAIIRNKRFRAVKKEVVLKNLLNANCYDGEKFKIVLGKSSKSICFDEGDELLQLKAATTYYHLTKAYDFFANELNSEYVKNLPPTIIRLEIKNKYNELGHYANDNLDPQYNNALTVPAGVGRPERGINSWNNEIWFRPVKKIYFSEIAGGNQTETQLRSMLKLFRSQLNMMNLQRFLSQLLLGRAFPEGQSLIASIMRTAGSSILLEAAIYGAAPIAWIFQRKYYKLDSALIPEIIYHEFSHLALSDNLALTYSTPVNEGLADFFAGKIANSSKLATKIKKYNTFSGKKAKRKTLYREQFETTGKANSDFVFGLLWTLQDVLGQNDTPKFIFNVRKRITTSSSIKDQLIQGILDECRESCKNPWTDRVKLLQLFHFKGM